jgi:predicted DNA-binding protein YlxM (UPF0122 family)
MYQSKKITKEVTEMITTSERVRRMIEGYYSDWQSGMGTLEIAKKYGITRRTVYARLQEIADANGVQRETLLERVHKEHASRSKNETTIREKVDPIKLEEEMTQLITDVKQVISRIDKSLNNEQEEDLQ